MPRIRERRRVSTEGSMLIESQKQNQAQRKRAEEEVLQLLLEYRQARSLELRDRIVLQYTSLVESVARRFAGSAEPVEDLAQEGYIGLITAIDLYDPAKNVKFSTYATHFIIGQIKHCLRDRGKIIKEPAWLQELNQRMTRAIDTLAQQLSRPPTNAEIAQLMGLAEEAVTEMMTTRETFKVTSIDGGSSNGEEDGGAIDIERKAATEVAVSFQLPVEERIVLETAMEKLKALEQTVLFEFYYKDLNQTEIARRLGISCNYVSHILRNSTKKLKKILVTDELRDTQLKMTLMRRRLEEQQAHLEQTPIVDGLTRFYNRHYFENRLEEELSRASRMNSEVAVLFIMLGGLEAFTRVQGTLKGDDAVLGSADIIRKTVRRVDIITRYNADTFALILPFTGPNVQIVRSRLETALSAWLEAQGWDAGRAPLTLGLGSATYPRDATQPQALSSLAHRQIAPEALPRAA
jgi:RNA polymerase sigma-B factor